MAKINQEYAIGVDIGGTKMLAVLFDGKQVIADYSLATPKDTLDHFLIMLKAVVEPLLNEARKLKVKVKGVGLGVSSVLDSSSEVLLFPTNLNFLNNVHLPEKFFDIINLPIKMDNDAYCFTRAEVTVGAAKSYKNVFGITLGTGIGGGWWYQNDIYRGAHGAAAQIWRTVIDVNTGLYLEEAYHRLSQNNPGKLSQEAVLGDPLAEKAYKEIGEIIGIGLANIANTINPEIFVIGGGVIQSADLFFSHIKKAMKANIDSSEAAKKTKVIKSKLGKNAGAIGAALLIK